MSSKSSFGYSTLKILVVFLSAVALFFINGCGRNKVPDQFQFNKLPKAQEDPLIIGQVPSRSVVEILDQKRQFVAELTNELGRDVQMRFANSYGDILNRMKHSRYDLVFLGPLSYVKAVDQGAPYHPLVQPQRFGKTTYRSMIITHRDSSIRSVDDLRNRTMAFVDPLSTSGYLIPKILLKSQYGINISTDLRRSAFVGGHDQVVRAVYNRTFDAGAVFVDARNIVKDIPKESFRILVKSDPIPSEPIAVRNTLDKDTTKKLRNFFLRLHKSPEILEKLGDDIQQFRPSSDTVYERIRKLRKGARKK
ncbi:MAG: phosphate/phosphite/phosphonate ABC transporter substrate-binding protein [bacterium]